jgi:hypothetical protein
MRGARGSKDNTIGGPERVHVVGTVGEENQRDRQREFKVFT